MIDENSEDRFGPYEEVGKAARHRLDMKIQWDRVNVQCGERWKVAGQLFDGMIYGAEPAVWPTITLPGHAGHYSDHVWVTLKR